MHAGRSNDWIGCVSGSPQTSSSRTRKVTIGRCVFESFVKFSFCNSSSDTTSGVYAPIASQIQTTPSIAGSEMASAQMTIAQSDTSNCRDRKMMKTILHCTDDFSVGQKSRRQTFVKAN